MADRPEPLLRYLAKRDEQRATAVNNTLGALTNRERALIKDAAVMGYVQGTLHPQGQDIPGDRQIVAVVVEACLAHPDLYPAISRGEETGA